MNQHQLNILAAFDAAMQTFVDVWQSPDTTQTQACVAYGGAAALLTLAQNNTDAVVAIVQAKTLLNEAAKQLGLPETN